MKLSSLFVISSIDCFNFDVKYPIVKLGEIDSNFGYAVESFKFQNGKEQIIVGAPTLTEESYETGGVYSCPFNTFPQDCVLVSGLSGDRDFNNSRYGQTLASSDGRLVACAPKYIKKSGKSKSVDRQVESLVGYCDLFQPNSQGHLITKIKRSLNSPIESIPHARNEWQERHDTFHYAKAQYGISAATNDNGEFVLGAGGTLSWSGSIVSGSFYDSSLSESPYCKERKDATGQLNGVTKWCNDMGQSTDSYGGSATLILDKMPGYNEPIYVMGSPGDEKYGSVRFYRKNGNNGLKEVWKILGREIFQQAFDQKHTSHLGGLASSFGYSLTKADLNGDGLDDLLIGAPQYFDYAEKIGGAVFILFSQEGGTSMRHMIRLRV